MILRKQQLLSKVKGLLFPKSSFARECRISSVVLVGCLFLVVLPLVCHNLPNSVYYGLFANQKDLERLVHLENNNRIKKASDTLAHLMEKESTYNNTSVSRVSTRFHLDSGFKTEKPKVVLVLPTVSREKLFTGDVYSPKYLTQVVVKLMWLIDNLDYDYPFEVKLVLCNVGSSNQKRHEEAEIMSKYATVWTMPPRTKAYPNKYEKLKVNYAYCLNRTLELEPDYSFVIEDDALPDDNLFSVVRSVIQTYLSKPKPYQDFSTEHHRTLRYPAFVKFYHPTRLMGFLALDAERLPELFSFGIIFATLSIAIYYVINVKRRNDIANNIHIIWCVLFGVATLACYVVGRTNLILFHRLFSPQLYYLTPAPSCCTQAIIYPRHQIKPLLDYLDSVECTPWFALDHALDVYMKKPQSKGYLVQPNVFKHIGIYSAHKQRKLSALMGW